MAVSYFDGRALRLGGIDERGRRVFTEDLHNPAGQPNHYPNPQQ